MTYYVDIDNTICLTLGNNYEQAVPIQENIEKINKLYKAGHKIIYWTARGSTSGIDFSSLTRQHLFNWGCLFTDLKMGKPSFDFIIDDRALKIEELNG